MLRRPTEEDQGLMDEGDSTISAQLDRMRLFAQKANLNNQSQKLYSCLDFDRLVKRNPFENDLKLAYHRDVSDVHASGMLLNKKKSNQLGEGTPRAREILDQIDSSGTGDSYSSQASKDSDKEAANRKFVEESPSKRIPETSNDTKFSKEMNIPTKSVEKKISSSKEKVVLVDAGEKQFRTYPLGILRTGEKSRFSRDFDETPGSRTSGDSLLRQQGTNSSNMRGTGTPSAFSRKK